MQRSHLRFPVDTDNSIPTADGRIEVRVRLSESGSPVADRNVFFRVIDPPDAADYVRNANAHHVDDKRDTASPRGTLEVPASSACEGLPAGSPPVVLNQETATHEHTHLWLVNPAGAGGHCAAESWRGNGTFCLMHEPFNDPNHNAELDDGITDMHWGADSEYLTVRGAIEPMPQQ